MHDFRSGVRGKKRGNFKKYFKKAFIPSSFSQLFDPFSLQEDNDDKVRNWCMTSFNRINKYSC